MILDSEFKTDVYGAALVGEIAQFDTNWRWQRRRKQSEGPFSAAGKFSGVVPPLFTMAP